MKHRKIIVLAVLLVVLSLVNNASATSVYYERVYENGVMDFRVEIPSDIWYEDTNEGATKFPIFAKAIAQSHWSGDHWLVAHKMHLRVSVSDITDPSRPGVPAPWMDVYDYEVLCNLYGTKVESSFKAGVSGSFGDGESYDIGLNLGYSFSFASTDIQSKSMTYLEYSTTNYYRLGTINAVMDVGVFTYTEELGMVFTVGIPNQEAQSYNQHRFLFEVTLTVDWAHYWSYFFYLGDLTSTSYSVRVGDHVPSSDAMLYLLKCLDTSYSNP